MMIGPNCCTPKNWIDLDGDGRYDVRKDGTLVFDLDGDGQISRQERFHSRNLGGNQEFLMSLDRNCDGHLDTRELKRGGARVNKGDGWLGFKDFEVDRISDGRGGRYKVTDVDLCDGDVDVKHVWKNCWRSEEREGLVYYRSRGGHYNPDAPGEWITPEEAKRRFWEDMRKP